MRKFLLTTAAILAFSTLTSVKALAASDFIQDFSATYNINTDGTVDVTEDITYNAGGSAHHGIIRQVDLVKTNQDSQRFLVGISNVSVDAPYSDQSTASLLNLKIGDASTTFTGTKIYEIKYTLSGLITYFTDHDELYWDVTGSNWTIPIREAAVLVKLPSGIDNASLNLTCYTGPIGSRNQNCLHAVSPIQNSTASFKSSNINPTEGLTIVVGFPAGVVSRLDPNVSSTTPGSILPNTGILRLLTSLGVGLFYIVVPLLVIIVWFLFGRDPKVTPGPRAWFDPPKHLNGKVMLPAEVGTITDEKVDPRDISATIVSLAIRGFLKIKKGTGDKFTFSKTDSTESLDLEEFEQQVYDGLFKNGSEVTTKSLQKTFPAAVKLAQTELYKKLTTEGYFPHNPETVRSIYMYLGIFCLFTFNLFLGVFLIIISRVMPRKTKLGAQKKEEALSLKGFLSSQERQLNFQEQNYYFFEKLLPYAVAFGVTEVWAGRFRDITIPEEVAWYQGDTRFLNTILLANSLSNFNRAAESITHTPYSSTRSSGGFSSGFGGGGSSGGGGGGGGGGSSW